MKTKSLPWYRRAVTGRACKVYTKAGDEWKQVARTRLIIAADAQLDTVILLRIQRVMLFGSPCSF